MRGISAPYRAGVPWSTKFDVPGNRHFQKRHPFALLPVTWIAAWEGDEKLRPSSSSSFPSTTEPWTPLAFVDVHEFCSSGEGCARQYP